MQRPDPPAAFDPAAIREEWRTVPTDLAGWAMRAEAMLRHAERLIAAPCWTCGEPLTPENAPRVEGGIQCESCLSVWAVPSEAESNG